MCLYEVSNWCWFNEPVSNSSNREKPFLIIAITLSTNPSSYATLSVLTQKCWICNINISFKGGTGPISQPYKLRFVILVYHTLSKSMTLPFLDDLFHLASNDDIGPIYYSEQQYFHWRNQNNMLFIRYLRTAWATPSPDMGPKIPFLLYDNGFNCENWSSCWCDIDGLFWFSIVNPD